MINPSAIGWIDKYFIEQNPLFDTKLIDTLTFYNNIRKTGLIYGHIISINSQPVIDISTWKIDEISKVALLTSLFETYSVTKKSSDIQHFISAAVAFYTEMTPKDFGFFTHIFDFCHNKQCICMFVLGGFKKKKNCFFSIRYVSRGIAYN